MKEMKTERKQNKRKERLKWKTNEKSNKKRKTGNKERMEQKQFKKLENKPKEIWKSRRLQWLTFLYILCLLSPYKWQWTSRRVILIKNHFRAYSFQLDLIANRQLIRLQDRGTGTLRLYELDPDSSLKRSGFRYRKWLRERRVSD